MVRDMYPERRVGVKGLGDGFGKTDFYFHFDDGEVNSSISGCKGGDVYFRMVVSAFPDKLVNERLELGHDGVWRRGDSCMVPKKGEDVCFKHQYSPS
jgi:hypothetical protein